MWMGHNPSLFGQEMAFVMRHSGWWPPEVPNLQPLNTALISFSQKEIVKSSH